MFKKFGIFAVLIVLLAAACSPAGQTEKLEGSWKLVMLNGAAVVPGSNVTLEFTEDGIGGIASCNHYGGPVEVDGDQITLGAMFMTEMACVDEKLNQQEADYLNALGAVTNYAMSETVLTLTGPDVELVYNRQ